MEGLDMDLYQKGIFYCDMNTSVLFLRENAKLHNYMVDENTYV